MFKKPSILRAPKRVLQAALVCESDSLPLASQKAADSFSSCCSFFEATEPAVKASEAAHAQDNGNAPNSLKSPRRIKYFVSFLQFARWLEDFLNRRNCSRGLLLFLFPIICAYSPILDIGPTRSKASCQVKLRRMCLPLVSRWLPRLQGR